MSGGPARLCDCGQWVEDEHQDAHRCLLPTSDEDRWTPDDEARFQAARAGRGRRRE